MVTLSEIQHTRLKGELPFQSFCLKLVRRYWQDDLAAAHGRSGQSQNGVDITGRDNRNGFKHAAMQCKASETDDPRQPDEDELVAEVEKAKKYTPKLDVFYFAYGGNRDAKLQRKAEELTAANEAEGLFRVVVWSWNDIVERALDFQDVAQELIVRNELPTVTSLYPKRPRSDAVGLAEAQIADVMAQLRAAIPDDTNIPEGSDPIAEAKLDVWRDQIRVGNGHLLVDAIREFIRSLPANVHPHVVHRAHGNLGGALIQAGQFENAIVAFDEAAKAEPDTVSGHTFAARAALLRHKDDVAFAEARAALTIDPTDRFAASMFGESAPSSVPPAELEARLAATVTETEVAASICRRYSNIGDHDNALRVARAIKTNDWQKASVVAQAILAPFDNNMAARVGAPLTSVQLDLLEEARDGLVKAWDQVKTRGDHRNWSFLAANLTSTYRLLGQDSEADAVALEAYKLDDANEVIKQRAALAYIHEKNWPIAQKLAGQLAESEKFEDLLFAASISAAAKDWPNLERWTKAAWPKATNDEEKSNVAELILVSVANARSAADGLVEADKLRADFQPNITFETRVAELARRADDKKAVEIARSRLDQIRSQELDPLERFELADAFADDNQWSKAAELLEGLHALDRPSEILRRRLYALYRADERSKARELYESLKERALESTEVLRMGAAIYEKSGMLPEALKALAKALKVDKFDLRSRLDWAQLSIRNGDERSVQKWVKNAPTDFDADSEDLLELAQLFDRYGRRKEALKIGYDALTSGWGTTERVHMKYMSLFLLHQKKDAFLDSKTVVEDTVVSLENDRGGKATYKIEHTPTPAANVIAPTHEFAKALIGKVAGDTVSLTEGIGQPTTWRIVEIKHKYLDLLHTSMETHSTNFPNSRALGHYQIDTAGPNAFEPIFEQARQRAQLVDEATKLYQQSVLPVDGIAQMIGVDPVDAARGLRFRSEVVFDACIGAGAERDLALSQLADIDSVFADPITIGIWQDANLLPLIENLPLKLKVVQATIDLLTARADEARQAVKQKGGSLEAHGESFALVEQSKEQRQKLADSCSGLLHWVRQHADVLPTAKLQNPEGLEVDRLLSIASLDTIATAIETGTPAVIEDRRLRGLGAVLGLAKSGWTQTLLMRMRTEEKINHEQYVEAIATLQQQRVGFISVGAGDLQLACKAGFDSPKFAALADAISSVNVDIRSMLPVLVEFLTSIWSQEEFAQSRYRLTSEIFERMLRRPDGIKILRILVTLLDRKIKAFAFPMNLMDNWLADYVERFLIGHFIRDLVLA